MIPPLAYLAWPTEYDIRVANKKHWCASQCVSQFVVLLEIGLQSMQP